MWQTYVTNICDTHASVLYMHTLFLRHTCVTKMSHICVIILHIFVAYVCRICLTHMFVVYVWHIRDFVSYVRLICTDKHMWQTYVTNLCDKHMRQTYATNICDTHASVLYIHTLFFRHTCVTLKSHICVIILHIFVAYNCRICLTHMLLAYVCPIYTHVCLHLSLYVGLCGTGSAKVGIQSTTRFQVLYPQWWYMAILSSPGCHESRHARACEVLWIEESTYMWDMPSAPWTQCHTHLNSTQQCVTRSRAGRSWGGMSHETSYKSAKKETRPGFATRMELGEAVPAARLCKKLSCSC